MAARVSRPRSVLWGLLAAGAAHRLCSAAGGTVAFGRPRYAAMFLFPPWTGGGIKGNSGKGFHKGGGGSGGSEEGGSLPLPPPSNRALSVISSFNGT